MVAHNAMQALMTALRTPPDAIVFHIQMPGGTGIEALKKLKASVKGLGADDFLLKPIDPETLYRALCRATGHPLTER